MVAAVKLCKFKDFAVRGEADLLRLTGRKFGEIGTRWDRRGMEKGAFRDLIC